MMDCGETESFEREVNVEQILSHLTQSMHYDPAIREPAESYLSSYETNMVPGYLGSLVEIARNSEFVKEVRARRRRNFNSNRVDLVDVSFLCRIFDYYLS